MELHFTVIRTLILVGLLVASYFLGVFTDPNSLVPPGGQMMPTKGWVYTMAMVVIGAVCVSVIDHEAGTMDPISLRPLYIIAGVVLMAGGYWWGGLLRDTAANQSSVLELISSFC